MALATTHVRSLIIFVAGVGVRNVTLMLGMASVQLLEILMGKACV